MQRDSIRRHVLVHVVADVDPLARVIGSAQLPAGFNPSRSSFRFDTPEPGEGAGGVAGTGAANVDDDDDDDEEDNDATDGGAGGAGGAGDGAPKGHAKDIAKWKKRRDRYRGALISTLRRIPGLDVEAIGTIQVVGAGTESDPFRVDGLDELLPTRSDDDDDEENDTPRPKKKKGAAEPTVDEIRRDLKKATNRATRFERENTALVEALNEHAVVSQIRLAAAKYHAIDDDGGEYSDIVDAVRRRFKTSFEDDDETPGRKIVRVDAFDDDGEEMLDDDDNPMTVDGVVRQYLNRKPKLVEAKYRGGTGAGDSGVSRSNGNGNGSGLPGNPAAITNKRRAAAANAAVGALLGKRAAARAAEA